MSESSKHAPLYHAVMSALHPNITPTPEQQAVIVSEGPAILVVAGAGSGKTATMTDRIAYHVAAGHVRPQEVLGLTFTRKAAGELAERTATALSRLRGKNGFVDVENDESGKAEAAALRAELERPTIATYNAFASEIAASYGVLVGAGPSARLMTEAERWQLMKSIVDRWSDDPRGVLVDMSAEKKTDAALTLAAALIDNRISLDDARSFLDSHIETIAAMNANRKQFRGMPEAGDAWRKLRDGASAIAQESALLPIVGEYFAEKRRRGLTEFADQITTAARVIEEHPEIAQELGQQYRLVLLDEYQDTSVNQAAFLMSALARPLPGVSRSICAVGDPHQAIYGWRGASANALADFAAQSRHYMGTVEYMQLSTSFRNDRAILAAANAVASGLRTPAITVSPLESRRQAGPGRVTEIRTFYRRDSYRAMAYRIRDLIAGFTEKRHTPDYREPEIAILCRKREYMRYAAEALDEVGVPYEVVGGESLVARPEILTIRAALAVISNPARTDQLLRLLTYVGADAAALRILSAVAADVAAKQLAATTPDLDARSESNLVEALTALPEVGWHGKRNVTMTEYAHSVLTRLARILDELRAMRHLPLPDMIAFTAHALGLDVAAASRTQGGQRVRTALDSFISLGAEYLSNHPEADVRGFTAWLEAVDARENGGEEQAGEDYVSEDVEVHPGVVQILTIHSAKGLEWRDLVAIPELVETQFSAKKDHFTAWPESAAAFPYPLRADYQYLPQFDVRQYADKFEAGAAYSHFRFEGIVEEQNQELMRLAYVAFTRPVKELMLMGYAATDPDSLRSALKRFTQKNHAKKAERPTPLLDYLPLLGRSTFTEQIRAAEQQGCACVCPISDLAAPDWPVELTETAPVSITTTEVQEMLGGITDPDALEPIPHFSERTELPRWPRDVKRDIPIEESALTAHAMDELAQNVRLLVGEAEERRGIPNPERPYYTATDLVHVSEEPKEFLAQLRRPIPQEPSPQARRGSRIHSMIAHSYKRAATLDIDAELTRMDLPVDMERTTVEEDERLFAAFKNSRWAAYNPLAIEQSLEIVVAGHVIRCTIDAVFDTSADGEFGDITIVDWKTGRRPQQSRVAARELQLATYRLAWARSHDVPLDSIDACFVYLAEPEGRRELRAGAISEEELTARISAVLGKEHGAALFNG